MTNFIMNYTEVISDFLPYYDKDILELIQDYIENVNLSQSLSVYSIRAHQQASHLAGQVVVNYSSGIIKIMKINEYITCIKEYKGTISWYSLSSDKKFIVTLARNDVAKLWDVATGKCIRVFKEHKNAVSCLFSHNGEIIVTRCSSKMKFWNVETGECIRIIRNFDPTLSCEFSSDDKILVSCSKRETIELWNAETGDIIRSLQGHTDHINLCCISPDNQRILSRSFDGTTKLWDILTRKCVTISTKHQMFIDACKFSPDGKYIVVCDDAKTIRLWNVSESTYTKIHKYDSMYVRYCDFSPDGKLLISIHDHEVSIWDIETSRRIYSFVEEESMSPYRFSSDSNFLINFTCDDHVRFLDIEYYVNKCKREHLSRVCESLLDR